MAKLITQSEYAKRKGVGSNYIHELVQKGVIKLKDGKVDPDEADKAIEEYTGLSKNTTYVQAKTALTKIKVALAQLQYDREIGKVIERDKVVEHISKIAQIIRDSLLIIPTKIAHRVAAEKSPEKCREIIENEIRQALEELSRVDKF